MMKMFPSIRRAVPVESAEEVAGWAVCLKNIDVKCISRFAHDNLVYEDVSSSGTSYCHVSHPRRGTHITVRHVHLSSLL